MESVNPSSDSMYAHLTRHTLLVLTLITEGITYLMQMKMDKMSISLKCAILWEGEASHSEQPQLSGSNIHQCIINWHKVMIHPGLMAIGAWSHGN